MKISTKTWGFVLPVIVFGIILFMWNFQTPMVTDEYCFYRLSLDFPKYSSTSDWFLKDRPSMLKNSIDWDKEEQQKAFAEVYDTPLYPHNPLVPMMFSPLTKSLNWMADEGVIPHLEAEPGFDAEKPKAELITKILRSFSILVFLFSMWLIYEILYKKVGKNAIFFAVPLAASYQLLLGAFLFYWDVFMMFFFVLTWYLMDKKSKWAYLTACCMVNTKMFVALVFLIPLMVKNWRMILCGFSILPWFGISWIVTGTPFYFFIHYFGVTGSHSTIYKLYTLKEWILILVGIGIPFLVLMTAPIVKFYKKYKEYVAFLFVGSFYAFASGMGMTHMSTVLYIGASIFPIVVYEYKLSEKLSKFLNKKVANA